MKKIKGPKIYPINKRYTKNHIRELFCLDESIIKLVKFIIF